MTNFIHTPQAQVDRVGQAIRVRAHGHYWRLHEQFGQDVAMRHTRQRFGLDTETVKSIVHDTFREAV